MLVIGWLAILISVWTSGDRVIDLVFEEPDVVADTQATTDEPDNAAEHMLMRSQRAGSSALDAVTAEADLDACAIAVTSTNHTALGAAPPHHPPPDTPPFPFPCLFASRPIQRLHATRSS
jgi:uncharacterized protein (UPF0254 family)